jgi:phosphohistidine phosphatase
LPSRKSSKTTSKVFFVRHATAMEKSEALPDFERPLVKKGEKEAVTVARYLAAKNDAPDLMLSSFANRAIETAHLFAKAFRYPRQKILLRDVFYGNPNIEDMAKEIRQQPDTCRSLMLFGHDPALSQLAASLIKGFQGPIPKAGVAAAEFPIGHWKDMKSGAGRLLEFTDPTRLKAQKKKTRSDLETRLARRTEEALAEISRAGARAFRKEIRKSARRVAKGFLKTLNRRSPSPSTRPKRRVP